MCRYQKTGKLSVTCNHFSKNFKDKTSCEWFGLPVFIDGKAWCLQASINKRFLLNNGSHAIHFLGVRLYFLGNLNYKSVKCKYQLEIVPPENSNLESYLTPECIATFDVDARSCGKMDFVEVVEVLDKYLNKNLDSCTILAHVTMGVFMQSSKGGQSGSTRAPSFSLEPLQVIMPHNGQGRQVIMPHRVLGRGRGRGLII